VELEAIGWGVMDWISVVLDRDQWCHFVKSIMTLGSIKYFRILE
jgi:hypothetical protein